MPVNERVISAFPSFLLFISAQLSSRRSSLERVKRCDANVLKRLWRKQVWTPEVWDEARFDKAVSHHSPNNPEKQ